MHRFADFARPVHGVAVLDSTLQHGLRAVFGVEHVTHLGCALGIQHHITELIPTRRLDCEFPGIVDGVNSYALDTRTCQVAVGSGSHIFENLVFFLGKIEFHRRQAWLPKLRYLALLESILLCLKCFVEAISQR